MLKVYKKLVEDLSSGKPAVIAGIVRQDGSSPRSLGSKFLVRQDGSLVGSIGGGMLEAQAIRAAEKLMGKDRAMLLDIKMTGHEVAGTDMICGGNVEVLLHGFTPEAGAGRDLLPAVLRLLEKGGRGVLAVGPIPESGRDVDVGLLFYRPGDGPIGSNGPNEGLSALTIDQMDSALDKKAVQIVSLGPDRGEVVLEPHESRTTAIIFGGGHISVNLAPLLDLVGFRVVIVDDRKEFAGRDRFPRADQLVVDDYQSCFEHLDFTPSTYVVIVTRGHLHDKTVLAGVLKQPARYVGMIGSRRKRAMIYEALLREGVSQEQIDKVYSPIGLEIGAETPEEIAVAITAEMIQVRSEGLRPVKDWKV